MIKLINEKYQKQTKKLTSRSLHLFEMKMEIVIRQKEQQQQLHKIKTTTTQNTLHVNPPITIVRKSN